MSIDDDVHAAQNAAQHLKPFAFLAIRNGHDLIENRYLFSLEIDHIDVRQQQVKAHTYGRSLHCFGKLQDAPVEVPEPNPGDHKTYVDLAVTSQRICSLARYQVMLSSERRVRRLAAFEGQRSGLNFITSQNARMT